MKPPKVKRVGIATKYENSKTVETAELITNYIKGRVKVYYTKDLAPKLNSKNILDFKKPKVDLIITVGGDGTMLKTIKELNGKKIPVVGVMRGRVGFLTEIDTNLRKNLDRLLSRDFIVEERTKLNVKLNQKDLGDVLNEVVVTTSTPAKMQIFDVRVHTDKIDQIDADGIILATPTGSTAYAMSAGGPLIDPTVQVYTIVPMSPLRLSARALVVSGKAKTTLKTITKRKSLIVLDGYYGPSITNTDTVEITQSGKKAYLVKLRQDFFQKIRKKFR